MIDANQNSYRFGLRSSGLRLQLVATVVPDENASAKAAPRAGVDGTNDRREATDAAADSGPAAPVDTLHPHVQRRI